MNKTSVKTIPILVLLTFIGAILYPCTMVLVGKKASEDGSVLLAHNNDLPGNIAAMIQVIPAGQHGQEEIISFRNGLQIPQAAITFRMLILNCYYGFSEGDAAAVNEYQVAIAGGVALKKDRNAKAEAADPLVGRGVTGYIRYIALQRSRTARECVEWIGKMYSKYGIAYPSGVGVADPDEVWYIEAGGGRCWVAGRIPDDSYMAVANGYRIGEVNFKDKKNFIFPPYLKRLVMKKGLWHPEQGAFNFAKTFGRKLRNENNYYNTRRVWRIQNLLTSSRKQDPEALFYPEMLKPDKPVTIQQLTTILRDRYRGTPFDIVKEAPAAAHEASTKERVIGVPNTVHTDVIQLRKWLPADIGAVMWAGLAAAPTTAYVPYYCGIKEVPETYGTAGPKYDDQSAFWIFRDLTILVQPHFERLIDVVLPVWQGVEGKLFSMQGSVDRSALELYKKDKDAAREFLTFYSNGLALQVLDTAKQLAGKLKTHIAKGMYSRDQSRPYGFEK